MNHSASIAAREYFMLPGNIKLWIFLRNSFQNLGKFNVIFTKPRLLKHIVLKNLHNVTFKSAYKALYLQYLFLGKEKVHHHYVQPFHILIDILSASLRVVKLQLNLSWKLTFICKIDHLMATLDMGEMIVGFTFYALQVRGKIPVSFKIVSLTIVHD